jgi:hypothetical protein
MMCALRSRLRKPVSRTKVLLHVALLRLVAVSLIKRHGLAAHCASLLTKHEQLCTALHFVHSAGGHTSRSVVQPCIEDIKALYFTFIAVNNGPKAEPPVDAGALAHMRATINGTLIQVLSRDQMMLNLAATLTRTKAANPLRGVRYMLNTVLKVVEGPLAPDVRNFRF